MPQQIAPESSKTPYYPALDGLRTVAVVMVFLVHTLPNPYPYGWLGVQIFFVLSGFLITGILFDTRHAPHRFRDFYVRRSLRIFPLYYGALLFCTVVLLATHAHLPQLFGLWWIYAGNFFWLLYRGTPQDGLVTGRGLPFGAVGHLWSLAVEEQFYLVWPVIVFAVKDRRRLMQLSLLLIACRFILAGYWESHLSKAVLAGGVIYRMLPTQCDSFLIGGLLALWLRGNPSARLRTLASSLAIPSVALYASLLWELHRHPRLLHGGEALSYLSGFQARVGLTLANLVSGVVLLAAIRRGSWIYRLGSLPPMRSLGKVSYGLYLFHLPLLVYLRPKLAPWYARHALPLSLPVFEAVVVGAVTIGVSYLSYYLYERPFLLLKNRFTARPLSKTASRPGESA